MSVILLGTTTVLAQRDTASFDQYKHEIGLDVANTIFLIREDAEVLLLNYKYHFENIALRAGFDFVYGSSDETGETEIATKTGIEWKKTEKKWQVFYGSDVLFSYQKFNSIEKFNYSLGVSPFIGFRFYASPRFSLSTEPHLIFRYRVLRDSESFDPEADTEEWEITLGSVGSIYFNFHF